jgi:hypothetical protein
MREVTKDEFFATVGQQNVHPYMVTDRYPYTEDWRTPRGVVLGRVVPEPGTHPHLFTSRYYVTA